MATCYVCGASDAHNRRETYTGYSSGNWFSKRSSGHSSRTYYGVRTVCDNCAKQIDDWNTFKVVAIIAVVVILIVIGSFSKPQSSSSYQPTTSSNNSNTITARIIAKDGLHLRNQPNSNGMVLLIVPYNETVSILDENGNNETISGQTANWYKVNYNGTEGWLWSGYLQQE